MSQNWRSRVQISIYSNEDVLYNKAEKKNIIERYFVNVFNSFKMEVS